jgi:hypothetical protein
MAKIQWDMHRWETCYELENLGEYLRLMEEQFSKVKEAAKNTLPNRPSGLSEEEYSDWQSEINFYEERFEKFFPSKLRYSFITLLQIVFEVKLKSACDEIARRKKFNIKEKDFRGASIERAEIFITKVLKINPPKQNTFLKDLQKIRDCIVHCNGNINLSRDKTHLNNLTINQSGISKGESGSIVIEREYCEFIFEKCFEYFYDLFESTDFGPVAVITMGPEDRI